MPATFRLSRRLLVFQHAMAAIAVGFAYYLHREYGGAMFPGIFLVIGLVNEAMAVHAHLVPVIELDEEGLTVKRAILAPRRKAPWSKVKAFRADDAGYFVFEVQDEPEIRLPRTALTPGDVDRVVELVGQRL